MAGQDELVLFVKDGLGRGMPRAALADVLGRAGWTPPDIDAAVRRFADVEFPIPVPRPAPSRAARDAFLYLVLFSTLYSTAFHIGQIAWLLIDRVFPDAAAPAWSSAVSYTSGLMRWALASLVVSLPVFLYASTLAERAVAAEPERRESSVRRWLTYLTLFAGVSVLLCDLMTLVYSALGGELTVRFVLKVLTIGVVSACVVGYVWDLRGDEAPRS